MNQLIWRYQRQRDVLYVWAHPQRADRDYSLICRYPDGTSRTLGFPKLAPLYDYLHLLENELGAEGWELLPVDHRAPNRLPTPICNTCWPRKPVETTLRTLTHVHFQCAGCHYKWVVPKPGVLASHTDL